MQKNMIKEVSNKIDMLVSAYKKTIRLEKESREEKNLAKKLVLINEAVRTVKVLKQINLWAETNLKNKKNAFHNNYLSVNSQYKIYMEIIFKEATIHNNNLFAKAMLEKNNKLMDFNGRDFLSSTPINIAIEAKNSNIFNYLIEKARENNSGVIVNFEKDSASNKNELHNCRNIVVNNFIFEKSPLFTAISLFDKDNFDCKLSNFVVPLVGKGGQDLPRTLYLDVSEMKNAIDFINEYRSCIHNGFANSNYTDMKNIIPMCSQQMDLGYNLACGIKIEEHCPKNYDHTESLNDFFDYAVNE